MKLDARELQQQIANLFLEYPELKDDEVMRIDMLEGATDIQELLTAVLGGIADAEAMSEKQTVLLENLKARKARYDRQVEFLRAMIGKIMAWADLQKVVLPEATLSMRLGQQKLIGDPDVALLPEDLIKVTRTPDRPKIREALRRGENVPECTLSNAEPALSIYPR